MARAAHGTAAAFSAHFSDLEIQKQVLKPLGVRLVEGSGREESEARLCQPAEFILWAGSLQSMPC